MNLQLCSAHEWAINANNSGECMRCGVKVASSSDAKLAPRCIVHWVSKNGGWTPEPDLKEEDVDRYPSDNLEGAAQ